MFTLLLEACTDVETSLLKPIIHKVCLLRGRSGTEGVFTSIGTCAYMQYMEPMKTEGRKQSIKQELKVKTRSFQTRTYKEKKKNKSPFNFSFSNLFPKAIEYQHQLVMQRLKPRPKHWQLLRAHFINDQKHRAIHPWAAAVSEIHNMRRRGRKKKKEN